MSSNYHYKELDLATMVCDMNGLLLQAPGDRFGRRDAEDTLGLIKRSGDSADKLKTIGDLARMRCSGDLAESGGRVLLTGVWDSGVPGLCPTGSVHGTGGVYGYGHDEGQGDDGALGSFATMTSRAPPGRRREPSALLRASPSAGADPPRAGTSNTNACMMRRAGTRCATGAAPSSSARGPACSARWYQSL